MPVLTQARLHEVLDYDPKTGVFRWKVSLSNRAQAGSVAGGSMSHGYLRIAVDGVRYTAHRLAWFYVYGVWPSARLDHRDTNPAHNWINNLREATMSQNLANQKQRRTNTSGHKGVTFWARDGNWKAQIGVRGKNINLGYFPTREAAAAAYAEAAREAFGEFARVA